MKFHRQPLKNETPNGRFCVLAIGNFDGIHAGHQALIAVAQDTARALNADCGVLTFSPHPQAYFATLPSNLRGTPAPLQINNFRSQMTQFAALGLDVCHSLRFDAELASLTPEQFAAQVLRNRCKAVAVWVGVDFRFGAQRAGNVMTLRELGVRYGFSVHTLPDVTIAGQRTSSSQVRNALLAGDMGTVQTLLQRPYSIFGHVLHGAKLGRTLGFPTLNIDPKMKNPAARGIFVVKIEGLKNQNQSDFKDSQTERYGVASLGLRPALAGTATGDKTGAGLRWLLEVNVFDWAGDAYGSLVNVTLLHKLRDETDFAGLDALKIAIAQDVAQARAWLQLKHS